MIHTVLFHKNFGFRLQKSSCGSGSDGANSTEKQPVVDTDKFSNGKL